MVVWTCFVFSLALPGEFAILVVRFETGFAAVLGAVLVGVTLFLLRLLVAALRTDALVVFRVVGVFPELGLLGFLASWELPWLALLLSLPPCVVLVVSGKCCFTEVSSLS